MCPVPVVPVVYTGRIRTEHTWYFTVVPTSAFWNRFCAELIGLVCVVGRDHSGRRVKTPFPHPSTGASRRRCRIASAAVVAVAAEAAATAAAAQKLAHVPRVRVVGRRAGKTTGTPMVPTSTSTTFGVGAGEHELSPASAVVTAANQLIAGGCACCS